LAQANVWRGWALAERGQQEEGISLMRHGMDAFHAAGVELERPYMLALLGEVYAKMGEQEQGRNVLAEARAIVDKTGERCWEAELHRLEGELTLLCTRPSQELSFPEAESSFHKALEVARRQEAKSLELRAATSLARLWQSQGKIIEACDLLSPVYSWFTEGFDTADLKDAKAVLATLSEDV
jgi:adenylate cyclase